MGRSPSPAPDVARRERTEARTVGESRRAAHAAGHRRRIVRSSRAPAARPHAGPAARVGGTARAGGRGRRRVRQVRDPRALAGNSRVAGGRRARDVGPDPGDRALYRAKQSAALQSTCSSSSRATRRRSPRWARRSPRSRCINSRVAAKRARSVPASAPRPTSAERTLASASAPTRPRSLRRRAAPLLPVRRTSYDARWGRARGDRRRRPRVSRPSPNPVHRPGEDHAVPPAHRFAIPALAVVVAAALAAHPRVAHAAKSPNARRSASATASTTSSRRRSRPRSSASGRSSPSSARRARRSAT